MNSQNNGKENHHVASETNDDIQSVLASLVNEENEMANEIYALAERLNKALKPGGSDQTCDSKVIESLKDLNSSIEDALASVIKKEIKINGKVEEVWEQSRHADNGERFLSANISVPVSDSLKT